MDRKGRARHRQIVRAKGLARKRRARHAAIRREAEEFLKSGVVVKNRGETFDVIN